MSTSDAEDDVLAAALAAGLPAIADRVEPVIAAILRLASHAPLEEILAIHIGSTVITNADKTTVYRGLEGRFPNVAPRVVVPTKLWIAAEAAMAMRRLKMIERWTYPTEGPFFYESNGRPITMDDVLQAVRDSLR